MEDVAAVGLRNLDRVAIVVAFLSRKQAASLGRSTVAALRPQEKANFETRRGGGGYGYYGWLCHALYPSIPLSLFQTGDQDAALLSRWLDLRCILKESSFGMNDR